MSKIVKIFMALVVVVGMLIACFVFNGLRDTKAQRVRFDLGMNAQNLQKIKEKCGRFPVRYVVKQEMDQCAREADIKPPALVDPWGSPYIYLTDGMHFVLKTVGEHQFLVDESLKPSSLEY